MLVTVPGTLSVLCVLGTRHRHNNCNKICKAAATGCYQLALLRDFGRLESFGRCSVTVS